MDAADPGGSTRRKRRAVAWGAAAAMVVIVAGFAYLYRPSPALTSPAPSPTSKSGEITTDVVVYDFSSPQVAWALHYPTRATPELQFWISRTVDGGRHWQVRFKGRRSVQGYIPATLRFFDGNHGFVFLMDSPPQLLRTSDAGASWQPLNFTPGLPDPRTGRGQLAFGDAGQIWILSSSVDGRLRLDVTTDAGDTWQQLADPPAGAQVLILRRTSEAWLSAVGPGPPRAYRSMDGGRSWQSREIPLPPDVAASASRDWSTFVRLLPGVGVIGSPYCSNCGITGISIWSSFDGGVTWRLIQPFPGSSQGSVVYQDDLNWWVIFDKALHRTSDAGQTWTQTSAQLPEWTFAPIAVDKLHAWARLIWPGEYGLATTSDAGLHWTRVTVPQST